MVAVFVGVNVGVLVAVFVAVAVAVGVLVGVDVELMGTVNVITRRTALAALLSKVLTNLRPNVPAFKPFKIRDRLLPLCQPVRFVTC